MPSTLGNGGAGLAGDIMTMPGLVRVPAAEWMKVTRQGKFARLS
jgi:formyltetrahydrofolate synthetase